MARRQPAWILCPSCEDYWCTIHGEHVYDCPCPAIEVWAKRGLDPYTEPPPLRRKPGPKERPQGSPARRPSHGSRPRLPR